MTQQEQELYQKLLDDAHEAAFAAAEAMDRRELKEWMAFQEKAAKLRKQAEKLASGSKRSGGRNVL